MSTDISLGEILHISLDERAYCFGPSKSPNGCKHRLGEKVRSRARIILVQTLGQLERGDQTIDQHLINLSNLLVHPKVHCEVATKARRESLKSQWQSSIQEFRQTQASVVAIEILPQTGDHESENVRSDEALGEDLIEMAPVLASQIDTPNPSASIPPASHTVPDPTPVRDLHVHTEEEQQEGDRQGHDHRTLNAFYPIPEPPRDRISLTPACSTVTRNPLSADDVSFEHLWVLLIQLWSGIRALMFMKTHTAHFGDVNGWFSKESVIDLRFLISMRFSLMKLVRSLIFTIPFYYGLFCLTRVLLGISSSSGSFKFVF